MDPNRQDLRQRTKGFALMVVRLCSELPNTLVAREIGRQLLRSGTSPGAHYREACRAKSDADFVSKIEGALQELAESGYWLEILRDGVIVPAAAVEPVMAEAHELIAMFVTMVRNVKQRRT